ncbi:MAG: DUF1801 domain-containing protein [Pseudomonadales bacterium]|nr:DUF1801 domain-containing protein [Pseudomonadales bacterium]
MVNNKTRPTKASVGRFIGKLNNARRAADAQTCLAIYKDITGLPPIMWGPAIIGFGSHGVAYAFGRKTTLPAASFSPRKTNMTLYVGDEFEGAATLYAQLGKHRKSIACLYINKFEDVDLDILKEIISRQYKRLLTSNQPLTNSHHNPE